MSRLNDWMAFCALRLGHQDCVTTLQEEASKVMRTSKLYNRWGGIVLAILMVVIGAATAAERSTGQVIDDAMITTKVKASFAADPQVSALAINVDTVKGVVSLIGVVDSEPERQRAIQLAQGIEGVMRVDADNLRVKR
jgi:osmotically-inducible protein OsmY